MVDVHGFSALRPRNDLAGEVIALPYDVLSDEEARAFAANEKSFVRITRAEADMPVGTDAHDDATYEHARKNLETFVAQGWLVEDKDPVVYVYAQKMGAHKQNAVVAVCSVKDYDEGRIKKHEYTRPDKEDDRTHHMEVLNAQVGLVFLAQRRVEALETVKAAITKRPPLWSVTTEDGVRHELYRATTSETQAVEQIFQAISTLYIADGHHRSAAASRVSARRRDASSSTFIAGIFSDDELQVLPYNRWVKSLRGQSTKTVLTTLGNSFVVERSADVPTVTRGAFGMYLDGAWYVVTAKPNLYRGDPVADLDVSLLQDHVLAPMFAIDNPRTSNDIEFVGGIRGSAALTARVDKDGGVAFLMPSTGLDQLFAVADKDAVMPPKSTWFEPKLREGVVLRRL